MAQKGERTPEQNISGNQQKENSSEQLFLVQSQQLGEEII